MTVSPTNFDVDFGELAEEMIRENGRSLLLRQPTRVELQSGSNAGAVTSSPLSSNLLLTQGAEYPAFAELNLTAAAAAAAGATVLSLDFGSYQAGYLVPGDELAIAGHASSYVVTGDIYSLGEDQSVLAGVAITPQLELPLSIGEAISATYAPTRDFEPKYNSTLTLDAAGAVGLLVPGDVLEIDGESYTVKDGPYSVTGDELVSVAFEPALAAPVAKDTVVTVTFAGTFSAIKGVVSSVENRLIQSGVAKIGDLQVLVSRKALTDAGLEIEEGDELHLGADTTAHLAVIERKVAIPSGELDAAYTLIARLR